MGPEALHLGQFLERVAEAGSDQLISGIGVDPQIVILGFDGDQFGLTPLG